MTATLLLLLCQAIPPTQAPPANGTARSGPTSAAEASPEPLPDLYTPSVGSAAYDVEHYRLDLTVLPDPIVLHGIATITATVSKGVGSIMLDLDGALTVSGVALLSPRADPPALPPKVQPTWRHTHDKLVVRVEGGNTTRRIAVAIWYHGVPNNADRDGLPIGLVSDGFSAVAYQEPDGAHLWFPCNDHPSDKATTELHVTTPPWCLGAAGGTFSGYRVLPGGWHRFSWASERTVATYLVPLAVGPFLAIARDASVPILDFVDPDSYDDALTTLEPVVEMLPVLTEWFGPYPFARYGHVLSGEVSGGMENQTMTVLSTWAARFPMEDLLVHELAHQWFGNWVTPSRWTDLWLNEGFASYAEVLWQEHLQGKSGMLRALRGHRRATLRASNRGDDAVGDPPVEDLFGDNVYGKGAMVLHILRRYVGDEAFFASLRDYLERHGGGNASTADLEAAVKRHSSLDISAFFDAWVRNGGLPAVALNRAGTERDPLIRIEQTGERVYPFRATVLAVLPSGPDTIQVLVEDAQTEIPLPEGWEDADLVLDPDREIARRKFQ